MTDRRAFLTGLISATIAAPAIVRAASLDLLKGIPLDELLEQPYTGQPGLYNELIAITRGAFFPHLFVQSYVRLPQFTAWIDESIDDQALPLPAISASDRS
jgi:hypothetical protein